jgi:flagellar hook-associated protein 2
MSSITPTSSTTQTGSTTSTTTSTTTSSGPPITFNGLISGLNTTAIINALLQAYEQPQRDIQQQINQLQANLNDYQL